MLCRKQDAAPRIDGETPHPAGDAAGESELARRIEKKKHAFADAVALAARPQANPLRDGQILTRSGAANRVLNVECDGNRLDRLAAGCRTTRNRSDGARKIIPAARAIRGKPIVLVARRAVLWASGAGGVKSRRLTRCAAAEGLRIRGQDYRDQTGRAEKPAPKSEPKPRADTCNFSHTWGDLRT